MAGFHMKHRSNESAWLPDLYIEAFEDEDYLTGSRTISDEVYVEKMENILSGPPYMGVPPEPSCIANNVYLGTSAQGENLDMLRRMRITHVLNVDGFPAVMRSKRASRYKDTTITYEEMPIEDRENFDIWPYFSTAYSFINYGRIGGRVLICDSGVSRGGAIAMSFLIRDGKRILDATQQLKSLRRVTLSNRGFMKQLVTFARTYGLLDSDPDSVKAPKYGRKLDRYRLISSHLPTVL